MLFIAMRHYFKNIGKNLAMKITLRTKSEY